MKQPFQTRLEAAARRWLGRLRAKVRDVVPETLRMALRRRRAGRWFRGDYATWAAARAASDGYDADAILQRVLTATLKVQAGQAAFERDSVLFAEPEPDTPLLAALGNVRAAVGGGLRVLDFGGSLGSTYWRLRWHLPPDAIRAWDIVEQPAFVAAGRAHVRAPGVGFFASMAEAEADGGHDVVLCSTALQYLEAPRQRLMEWAAWPVPFLLLNNLPLHTEWPTRLRVQHVPPSIYSASYPVWFFNRAEFLSWLEPGYTVVGEFASEAVWPVDGTTYPSTGLLLRRKLAA